MAEKNQIPKAISDRALEMIMRDVLDGVMELSLGSAFTNNPAPGFEIIEIASATRCQPQRPAHPDQEGELDAQVIAFPGYRQARA